MIQAVDMVVMNVAIIIPLRLRNFVMGKKFTGVKKISPRMLAGDPGAACDLPAGRPHVTAD